MDRYVDAGIVREGPYGDQGDGAYSAGVSSSLYTYTRSGLIRDSAAEQEI